MSEKVLCVDDDSVILDFYRDYLQRQFDVDTALSGAEALDLIRERGPYAVVVADMNMPEMNGVELLTRLQQLNADTVRMMLTADTERETAVRAINQSHIFQLLTKPCAPEMLAFAIEAGIRQYRLIVAERELLEKTLSGAVKMLTEILSMVDPESFGNGQKIRDAIRPLCQKLNFTQIWELELAAVLCHLGFVTIPPLTIQRMRAGLNLTQVERGLLARIPEFGRKLLLHIPRLEQAAEFIYFQGKNYDGTGFPPESKQGEDIPFGARILRVLSDMVNMEVTEQIPRMQALSRMKQTGGRYDPRIVQAAIECFLNEDSQGRAVMLNELSVGDVLLSAIETVEGMLIVPANTPISPMLIEKLGNFTEVIAIREPIFVKRR